MKTKVSILSGLLLFMFTSTAWGQITFTPGGNIGINAPTPASKLSVNGSGNDLYAGYFHTTGETNGRSGIVAEADKPTTFSGWVRAVRGSIESGYGYAIGVYGSSYSNTPSNAGRSYGVYGQAGNATNGANYGVHALLRGSNSGTALFAHDRVSEPNAYEVLPNGVSYAGYFLGKGYFSGRVGIGYNNPSYTFQVNGSLYGQSLYLSSDKRFKKDIAPLENSLQKINKLSGVSYNFITEGWKEHKFTDKDQIGFIAQELKEVFPELVNEDKAGYMAINYVALIPVLTESIKELDKKTTELADAITKVETLEEPLNNA